MKSLYSHPINLTPIWLLKSRAMFLVMPAQATEFTGSVERHKNIPSISPLLPKSANRLSKPIKMGEG